MEDGRCLKDRLGEEGGGEGDEFVRDDGWRKWGG